MPDAGACRFDGTAACRNGAGAVAFSRAGDPSTGEFSEAVVIARFGETISLDDLVDANY